MNKNKLDSMLKTIDTFKHEPIYIGNYSLVDIATMLRQQQAEIEALKQIIDANNLNQNIGQFVKPTNEPVAWMDYLEHSDVYDLNVSGRGIPLYTHPVKEHFEDEPQAEELHEIMQSNTHPAELTDEEIIEIGLLTTDPRFSHIESPLLLEFARAILRKAQK